MGDIGERAHGHPRPEVAAADADVDDVAQPRATGRDVAGAVMAPSVVELPEGSRVFEAIEKAGGLTGDADLSTTNQAEILTDGQKLYIPTRHELEESRAGSPSSGLAANSSGVLQSKRININTADSQTLQQLKGVGPATAEKIINYRTENGKFKTIEDLKNVSGIGDKTFEKLKDKITV
jgi:competence protein ComEA